MEPKTNLHDSVWPPAVKRSAVTPDKDKDDTPAALPLVLCGEAIYLVGLLLFVILRNPIPMIYTSVFSFIAGLTGFVFGLTEFRYTTSRTALLLAIVLLFVNAFINVNAFNH